MPIMQGVHHTAPNNASRYVQQHCIIEKYPGLAWHALQCASRELRHGRLDRSGVGAMTISSYQSNLFCSLPHTILLGIVGRSCLTKRYSEIKGSYSFLDLSYFFCIVRASGRLRRHVR